MPNQSQSISNSYADYLNNITDNIHVNFNFISSTIGIPGNIISIFIFARLMRHKTNMGFMYIWQCSIDLCVLLLYFVIIQSNSIYGINLYNKSNISCILITFLRRFILHASSWIAVLTTFDRFTFVLYGHSNRFKFLNRKLNLTGIILVMFTIIVILNAGNFFYSLNEVSLCKAADFTIKFLTDFISVFILRTYIPFVLMLVFNIIMIRKIFKNKRIVSNQSSAISRKETQFTLTVIASNIYFLVLNFPYTVFYIFYDVYLYNGTFDVEILLYRKYLLVNGIFSDVSFFVQTFSFFVYLLSNKLFRKEFIQIICKISCIKSISRLYLTSQSRPISKNTPNPIN